MVKAYLRYEAGAVFGVVASVDANLCYDNAGKLLFSGALEQLCVWNPKQGLCVKSLSVSSSSAGGPKLAVSSIACSPSSDSLVACGYAEGSIRIWDFIRGTCETTLNGHKGSATALRYNKPGSMLASGSKDGDIILWDVVGEAGLYRLRGHKDQVTDLVFLEYGKKLISCSKDKFARVWDLDTQHCVQIIGGHHSEIWSLDVDPEERYMVTGSADEELRFYKIHLEAQDGNSHLPSEDGSRNESESTHNKWEVVKQFGEIKRQSKERVATVRFNKVGNILACQVAGKTVELFRVLDDVEAKRKAKKRVHRKKEKLLNKKAKELTEHSELSIAPNDAASSIPVVSDVFRFLQILQTKKKICSVSFSPASPRNPFLATLALSLNNNSIEVYSVESSSTAKVHTIYLPGHRSDIRSVALSSDSTMLMSTSHDSVKIWNPSTGSSLRTIESGYGLCSIFVPGNRFAIIGTKTGTLEVIDIGSSSVTEVIEAHSDVVRSIVSTPDRSGFITSSADHDVKFWEYQIVERDGHASKQLSISNTRTLKMNDDALVVRVSHDSKYIAVALLNSTIKVFFIDSLKFFLSLYGHNLPVLCMDISSDGDLLVSGSGDKNLKIWGLDFGDCHKSIFAHADSVTAVQFVRNTHYVFSAGKDRLVKYWDADKFELLLTLEGHHAAVWCLSISEHGDFLVTGSSDRSIRLWDRTEEPFFIEEEREKRLEEMFESGLDDTLEGLYVPKEEVPEEGVVDLAGKQTRETLNSTDKLIDALDMAEVEAQRIMQHKEDVKAGKPSVLQPNVLMQGLSPSSFVLNAISSVHSSDLVQTLLSLPFSDVLRLMSYLKDWVLYPDKVELVCRIATVLLQVHHNQLVATSTARPLLTVLQGILYKRVKECKDTLGFNLAAMDHLKQLMASKSDAPFRDAKAKLMEVRAKYLDTTNKASDLKERKKKKQKKVK